MSAEIVEEVAPITLRPDEAQRLASAVRGILAAAQRVLSGGRRLDAEEAKTVRRETIRAYTLIFQAEEHQGAEVIDLAQERALRRR